MTRQPHHPDIQTVTWHHFHLLGQVQGVGFRPLVYQLAVARGLRGQVSNGADGLHIWVEASTEAAASFLADVLAQAPALAKVLEVRGPQPCLAPQTESGFHIVESDPSADVQLLVTPDFALCEACRAELHDPANRRNGYAFTTCTHCGPRYSIIHELPYDRPATSMNEFVQCENCQREYEDPFDRRFFSQTNACGTCGPQPSISLLPPTGEGWDGGFPRGEGAVDSAENQGWIAGVVAAWKNGAIVAIKGIGGYLLTADATHEAAILRLRERKHRPSKPFALMYPNLALLETDVEIGEQEQEWLLGSVSPIVLARRKDHPQSGACFDAVAPGLDHLGVMLPYAPLFEQLLTAFGKPIVATSGNVTGAPICFRDDQAREGLTDVADAFLAHNRDIVVPQDDSVVRIAPVSRQPIILRRSRGLAPNYLFFNQIEKEKKQSWAGTLALGASLKSAFAFSTAHQIVVSQYLGDTGSWDTQQAYRHTLTHLTGLFGFAPARVVSDLHPHYFTTELAAEMSRERGIGWAQVQHHEAHFAAVLAENDLLNSPEPVLGVIWDGTGYGRDGHIWGGEFFRFSNGQFLRCYHLDYFDSVLGDKMAKEPRLSALCLTHNAWGFEGAVRGKFTDREWAVYQKVLQDNPLKTSSMGRLFDGVAALLGLADRITYEGEAALRLEQLAAGYFRRNGLDFGSSYFLPGAHYHRIPTQQLVQGILTELRKGKPADWVAAKFHYSLAQLVKIVANHLEINKIAFSGGVFQNALLLDLLRAHLPADYQLFFHRQLSPNDECIALGQIALGVDSGKLKVES